MKKYFAKESFILSSLDKKQKKQSLLVSLFLMVMFVFSGLTFFNALYAFAEVIGSIVSGSPDVAIHDALRSLPLFLSCFMSIWGLLLAHGLFRNVNDERREKSIKKNAIALLCFAAANLIGIIVMLIAGIFVSIVEGSPSPFYPLDSILYSLIYIGIAVFLLIYLAKLKEKKPFVLPSRGPIVTKARGLYCTFVSIWMLISLFCFAAFFIGLFIRDFSHGYLVYSIGLLLVYFVNFLFILVWEFYYNELKEENKKSFLLGIAIAGLVCALIAAALYFVGLSIDKDAPANAGFGILPVAFTASVNITTLIEVATPLIVAIVALIKGIKYRKQGKKDE